VFLPSPRPALSLCSAALTSMVLLFYVDDNSCLISE
jgi:hypothetical protein